MSFLRHLSAGIRALVDRRGADRDLDDEVRHYLELSAGERMRAGASREEAERGARVAFGGPESVKERVRSGGWEATADAAWRDLRYAVRSLRASPAFTITAVMTLALGIGANTAMFSVVNAVMLRPLPYAAPDRLATLWSDDPRHGDKEEGTSNLNFLDWRRQNHAFSDMAVVSRGSPAMLGGDEPERLSGEDISANMLPLLGAKPMLGRNLMPDEEWRGQIAILSYGLWQRRFGGRPEIIGENIELDGKPTHVIGVMPRDFFFPTRATEIWMSSPLTEREKTQRTQDTWRVVGRLRPGVTFAQAQVEMNAIGDRLAQEYPVNDPGFGGYGVNVVPMLAQVVGATLPLALWILLGAVSFVLAIACVNVANLLLVRGAARGHELAIRTALGAGRGRLLRQLLIENLLLSGASAVVGTLLAAGLMRVLIAWAAGIPRIDEIRIDGDVLAFTGAVAVVAALLFGLAPAWRTSRRDPIDALRDGGRRGATRSMTRLRGVLVVAECALAVVLLAGAGLLVRSLLRLNEVDAGFRPAGALLVRVALPPLPQTSEAQAQSRRRGDERMMRIVERMNSVPGVRKAGAIRDFVFTKNPDWVITTEDGSPVEGEGELTGEYVGPAFFAAVGATVVAGREFTDRDFNAPAVVMINESFARRYFPGVNAVGKRFREGGPTSRDSWMTVIGVVHDMHRGGLERHALPEFYMPWYARNMDIIVRTDGNVAGLTSAVRQAVRDAEPHAAITRVLPLADEFGDTSTQRRLQTVLLAAFSLLALMMSAVGIYGVMYYLVASRTQEIGVRMALGARASDATRLVIGEGMSLALGGVALGLAGALALTGLLSRMVFGVSARDPFSIGSGGLVLLIVALVACWFPARQAARIDPMTALRRE